jgi:para-nitrobenzyl esterase
MTEPSSPVIATRAGEVRGTDDGAVSVWKGIRYAEPATGALRWRAPVAAAPWEGVADASGFGPAAPQKASPAVPLGPGTVQDEDCLFLNVWRPTGGAEPKPVMVWIHGGAYTFGSSSQPLFDASRLVTGGDIVVVTINYRIGALGFLDLTSLATAEEPFDGNLALRDVLLALEWVRDNIAAFGGDPAAVTVAGESAGGGLVTALLATPSAEGLFARAIVESSPASSIYGEERARAVVERFVTGVGLDPADPATPAALRALDVAAVVETSATVCADVPREHPGTLAYAPVVDGDLLPEHPITVLAEGRGLPVPLLIGSNREEATLFKFMKSPLIPITGEAIDSMFAEMRAENPDIEPPSREQVMQAYETVRHRVLGLGIATDIGFRMPTVWAAAGLSVAAPTYLYRFDFSTPLLKLIGIGAAHATELPYVWGNLDSTPKDPTFRLGGRKAGEALSERVRERWVGFIRDGVPGEGWPAYAEPTRATLVIDRADSVVDDLDRTLRESWGPTVLSFQ